MNAAISGGAFALGLAVVAWVGSGYISSSPLALAITALIGAVHLAGGAELMRFRRDTRALVGALGSLPCDDALDDWLARLPSSLRQAVRLRIEGERLALPGPVLTPYLVGLLVLFGMLGTFLGLVLTLNGTVVALEGTTDLEAIRRALAAPVKGLAFAFGTSVAGVAASAMLGLVSAFCRRERMRVGQLLDAQIGGPLRRFSRAHQREQALDALRTQAASMPALVEAVSSAMAQMQASEYEAVARHLQFLEQAREQHQAFLDGAARQQQALLDWFGQAQHAWLERGDQAQLRFLDESRQQQHSLVEGLRAGHAQLADSVARSLSDSLTRSAELAGTGIRSGVEGAMAAITAESRAMQQGIAASMAQQLDALTADFEQRSAVLHERIDRQLATALGALSTRIDQSAQRLLADLGTGVAAIQACAAANDEARQAAAAASEESRRAAAVANEEARQAAHLASLSAMVASLREEWRALVSESIDRQEQAMARFGETVRVLADRSQAEAARTIGEVGRLMAVAAQAPEAAAELVGRMREQLSDSLARDNAALAERAALMSSLGGLAASLTESADEQRRAIDELVAASHLVFERTGEGFARQVELFAGRIDDFAARLDERAEQIVGSADGIAGSSAEVASLGETFGHAVALFAESNERLIESLHRIEGALEKTASRSDEQLAYYVAQARELIELSVEAQRQAIQE